MDIQEIEGQREDSEIGLLDAMFEREDEVVDEPVKSQLGELRSQVEVNVADYGDPYAERVDGFERLRNVLEQGVSHSLAVEGVEGFGKLGIQVGLSVPEHRRLAVQVS